jgi:hypothetical protein
MRFLVEREGAGDGVETDFRDPYDRKVHLPLRPHPSAEPGVVIAELDGIQYETPAWGLEVVTLPELLAAVRAAGGEIRVVAASGRYDHLGTELPVLVLPGQGAAGVADIS